jgi:hypothetical protein
LADQEMISGPDLGGGFLHQLTRERGAAEDRFVFHAQEGGQDAGGPPKGDPRALGWAKVTAACQFGGPRCWHREFLLASGAESRVRASYNRTRFVFEVELAQLYEGRVPPVEASLLELAGRIARPMEAARAPWHVRGMASAWLRRVPVVPMEIEIGTTDEGVGIIADALVDYLIEPLSRTMWPHGRPVRGARAFVGTISAGARVEWAVPDPGAEPYGVDLEWGMGEADIPVGEILLAGHVFRASRLEFALGRAVREGRREVVPTLLEAVRANRPDPALLRRIVEAGGIVAPDAEELIRAVGTGDGSSSR